MHTCWTDLSRRQHCKTSEVQADWYAWGTQTLIPDDWQGSSTTLFIYIYIYITFTQSFSQGKCVCAQQ